MATYNPFEDFNPAFTRYEYLEIPEIEDPLYGKMDISSQFDGISPDGTWIAKSNIPSETTTEKEEIFGKDIQDRMASTHAENPITFNNSGKADKISLKGSENLSKVIDEVSNEKGFEKLKDPNTKRLILLQAKRESSFNPTIQSKSSSASGYFQFIDSTRKRYSNYSKQDFLKDQKEQVRAAYKYLQDIHNTPSALKLKQQGYNDAVITALGWWYPRSMDMVLQGKKDFSLGGYSIKKALEDYG